MILRIEFSDRTACRYLRILDIPDTLTDAQIKSLAKKSARMSGTRGRWKVWIASGSNDRTMEFKPYASHAVILVSTIESEDCEHEYKTDI